MIEASFRSRGLGRACLWLLVPLAFTLWLSWRWTPDFAHADHWGLEADVLLADAEGKVTLELLARQMNDSRYVLSRALTVVQARLTGWNLRVEAMACVVMGGGIALLGWWMARRTVPGRAGDWLGGLLALLVLSPLQVMNWTFGVQTCYLLAVGAAVGAAAVFLTSWKLWQQTLAGILLAMAASWSFANGFVVWGIVVWGVLGWARRVRVRVLLLTLAAVLGTMTLNVAVYFSGYRWPVGEPLGTKLMTRAPEVVTYFLNLLGANFGEGWPQANNAARGRIQNVLAPVMGVLALGWLALLLRLHWRMLRLRLGASPAWMWIGLGGWSVLVLGMVALARTGVVLSNAFESRYLAFSVWAWIALLALTLLLPPTRWRRWLLGAAVPLMVFGWAVGVVVGVKYTQRVGYNMKMLHGTLIMANVAPEPQGLRGNDHGFHQLLPVANRLSELGLLRPALVTSPLVEDAMVEDNPAIEGALEKAESAPGLKVSGYAVNHARKGPADCVVLSIQPTGGAEIWWTVMKARTLRKDISIPLGLEGEHARIGWEWTAPKPGTETKQATVDALNYKVVEPPAGESTLRAYALDERTGRFTRLAGEIVMPGTR